MRPAGPALFLLFAALAIPALGAGQSAPRLSEPDRVRLAEAFRLAERVRAEVWPGWERTPMAVLLVADSTEYLVGHPRPTSEFAPLGRDSVLGPRGSRAAPPLPADPARDLSRGRRHRHDRRRNGGAHRQVVGRVGADAAARALPPVAELAAGLLCPGQRARARPGGHDGPVDAGLSLPLRLGAGAARGEGTGDVSRARGVDGDGSAAAAGTAPHPLTRRRPLSRVPALAGRCSALRGDRGRRSRRGCGRAIGGVSAACRITSPMPSSRTDSAATSTGSSRS